MRAALTLLLLAGTAWAGAARAGSVTVRNGTGETISGIHMAPAGSGSVGENRMRSQLPPGAEARITYSTGCQADVRLAFASGRTEEHKALDVCTDPRITAGVAGVAGPAGAPGPAVGPGAASASAVPAATPPARPGTQATAVAVPAKAPPPVVPPWTGRSLTRRFGGME